MFTHRTIATAVALSLAPLAPAGARPLGNYRAVSAATRAPAAASLAARMEAAGVRGAVLHVDERFGVPRLLRIERAAAAVPVPSPGAADPELAARDHLKSVAFLYGLSAADVDGAVLDHVHDTGSGAVVVKFHQQLGGVPVFQEEVAVVMTRARELVAVSGFLSGAAVASQARGTFALGAREALAAALRDTTGVPVAATDLVADGGRGGWDHFRLGPAARLAMSEPGRARRVWYHLPGELLPAWQVETMAGRPASREANGWGHVFSAVDGRLLHRTSLVARDAFSYRVWADDSGNYLPWDGPQGPAATPHPTGIPDGFQASPVPQKVVFLSALPPTIFSRSATDPWLPYAAGDPLASQVLTGNNAEAYADRCSPDGFDTCVPPGTPDVRGAASSPGSFDWTYDPAAAADASATQVQAALAHLFYLNNYLHDAYYDRGFDEAAGNGQSSNYGRGGVEGDSIKAEAQDFEGRNNANMTTLADGGRPTMQMFVFDGLGKRNVTVNTPGIVTPNLLAVGVALFGAAPPFSTTGDLAYTTPSDACTTISPIAGKIALIDRGNCTFVLKAKHAQAAGAIGFLVVNNVTSPLLVNMAGSDPSVTIPGLSISQADGAVLKTALASTTVNVTLNAQPTPDRDGTVDSAIVIHEWHHYLTNRLVGNSTGLETEQAGGLGEGWSDFGALLFLVRAEDATFPSGAGFRGAYALAGWTQSGGQNGAEPDNGYYFGIRRVPYSTDTTRDPLTFHHIGENQAIPTGASGPFVAFGADGIGNAEVHNAGEVWATMLWECYAALLTDPRYTVDQARLRMMAYLVASLKATPLNPTFLEARDALLSAAQASDADDAALFRRAFARRGAGPLAVGPARFSGGANLPVTERFEAELGVVGASFGSVTSTCDDHDAALDEGETGTLTIQLRNVGTRPLAAATAEIQVVGTFARGTSGALTPNPTATVLFPQGTAVSIPASSPGDTVSASAVVQMQGAGSSVQVLDLAIAFPAGYLADDTPSPFRIRGNYDETAAAAVTDEVEGNAAVWEPGPVAPGVQAFAVVEDTPGNRVWYAPDPDTGGDVWLTTPGLAVGNGTFGFSFRHRFWFESDAIANYDGGAIEISANGGATWDQILAPSFTIGEYNGFISNVGGDPNPLAGREAFVGASPGYPAFSDVAVDLGTSYEGQTVRIRFHIGADLAVGAPGWWIDSLSFTGLANTPFPAVTAGSPGGACGTPAPAPGGSGSKGGCGCGSGPAGMAPLLLLLWPAALLRRRRR